MASAHSLAAVSVIATASKQGTTLPSSSSSSSTLCSLSSLRFKPGELSVFPNHRRVALKGCCYNNVASSSVIDEEKRESSSEHETQVSNIRWHLSQGGFEEFRLLERLGEGKKATAIIGEVADELRMELVVMSMEAIHSKFIDANLLAEFIPCPVLLLPL